MRLNYGFATDIGRRRAQNQDNVAVAAELGLFVVADGMGGHRGGETASAMVAEIVPQQVRKALAAASWDPRQVITQAIREANRAIYARAQTQPQLQGMGTTTTALLFKDDLLTIGHAGDSRCYYFRPGAVWQATRDHSLVQERLRAGLITRADLKTAQNKNVITRSVGFDTDLEVEIYQMTIKPGDVFLVCSDGLSGQIDDPGLLEHVQKGLYEGHDVNATVEKLISSANANGGDDNITTVIVEVTS